MNVILRLLVIGCAIVAVSAHDAVAQGRPGAVTAVTLYELVLKDGSKMYGSVESEREGNITFKTEVGALVTVRRADVRSLRRISGSIIAGEFQAPDPNATRLFFAPTGRSLRRGQTYLGVFEIFMPFVQVGVTDRVSIGGGTPLLFRLDDGWDRPFWVTPKVQVVDTAGTQVSLGVFHVFAGNGEGGGIGYGVVTRGDDARALTVGAGLAYDTEGDRSPVLMVGGEVRVRRSLKIITENYVWTGGSGILSGGVRFFGEKLSADLGLAFPIGTDEGFLFPVVNFVYVF